MAKNDNVEKKDSQDNSSTTDEKTSSTDNQKNDENKNTDEKVEESNEEKSSDNQNSKNEKEEQTTNNDSDVPNGDYKGYADMYLNLSKQIQADFDNYRKRNRDAIENARNEGKQNAVLTILPCADSIDHAMKIITDENTLKGLKMVADQFTRSLRSLGVIKIDCLNKPFDPNFHNAISTVPCKEGEQPNTITQEVESGYLLNDKVIRYAKVIITK